MAEESKNNNNDVISLEGLDLDLNPAATPSQVSPPESRGESAPPNAVSPEELAENEFRKIKSERDRDLSSLSIREILAEEDAEFIKAMDEFYNHRTQPVPQDYNFHDDAVGFMYVVRKLQRLFLDPSGVVRRRWNRHWGEFHSFIEGQKKKVVAYLIYLKNGGYKDVIFEFRRRSLDLKDKIQKSLQWVWQVPWSKKFYFLIFLSTIYLSYLLIVRIFTGQHLPGIHFEGVTTLEAVADQVFEFSPRAPMEQFDSPIRHSDHTVLLGKIIANLKPTANSSPQPMGAFRFHFEASSRETAMELVDREKELLDLMQRTIEEFTWEELSTVEGKSRLKLVLRKKINETLNRGRVKKVLIETIVLKN